MENPYRGLASYKEDNSDRFFGRNDDIQRCLNLIIGHLLMVLTGKSGLGKTSLLQAGIFGKLREKHILPVPVRMDLHAPPEQFIRDVHRALINQIQHVHVEENGPHISFLVKDLALETSREPAQDQKADHLFDDQFGDSWTPASLNEYFKDIELIDQEDTHWTPCLVLDQFEEIFTASVEGSFLQHMQQELISFIENTYQAHHVVQRPDKSGRVQPKMIISIREDYFAQLTQFLKGVNFRNHAYYRIVPLNGEQAEEIINGPGVFDAKTRKKILQFFYESEYPSRHSDIHLRDLDIEPTILSLLCTQTFDILYSSRGRDNRILSIEDIPEKDLNQRHIIEAYFTRLLTGFSAESQAFIEDHLVTRGGARTPFRLDMNIPFREEIDEMEKKRLIKKIWIGGKEHIELIHDVVAPIIKDNRDHRRDEMDKRALEEKLVKEREQRERIQIQQSWTLFVSVSAMIIFTILLILMFKAKQEANEEQQIAEEAREFADRQALLAETARDSAEIRRNQAEAALRLAEEQRNEAIQARIAETEAKNVALTQEEIARRRKMMADELAFMEKKATIQYQILNKQSYADQLFSQSEILAKRALSEEEPEDFQLDALRAFQTVLTALYIEDQVLWIDSIYQNHVLPGIERSYPSDSSRFQALQEFQDNNREYLEINIQPGISAGFIESSVRLIYADHPFVYNALLNAYVRGNPGSGSHGIPLHLPLTSTDLPSPIRNISSSVYITYNSSYFKINDLYITGISFNRENTAYTASSGRILLKTGNGEQQIRYQNAGNSIRVLGFLDHDQIIVGKIRSNTRILNLDGPEVTDEWVLKDEGNMIDFFQTEQGHLYTLDENNRFWSWSFDQSSNLFSRSDPVKLDPSVRILCMDYMETYGIFGFGGDDGKVYLMRYDPERNMLLPVIDHPLDVYENRSVLDLAFNDGGGWMATSTRGSVDLWYSPARDVNLEAFNIYRCETCEPGGLIFDSDNRYILFGSESEMHARPYDLLYMVDQLEKDVRY